MKDKIKSCIDELNSKNDGMLDRLEKLEEAVAVLLEAMLDNYDSIQRMDIRMSSATENISEFSDKLERISNDIRLN